MPSELALRLASVVWFLAYGKQLLFWWRYRLDLTLRSNPISTHDTVGIAAARTNVQLTAVTDPPGDERGRGLHAWEEREGV